MAEPNPQPVQETAPQAAPAKGGGGVMGPIVAAIIIVAGIAGIFEFMVKDALETPGTKTPEALSAEQKPGGGGGDSSVTQGGDSYQTPIDLGEPILVNIKGDNNMVLSAKVSLILNTRAKEEKKREKLLKKIEEFKPMLVDAARAYLSKINESDWDNEEVHKKLLKQALNMTFVAIRRNVESDTELNGVLPSEPVHSILLPSFTAQ